MMWWARWSIWIVSCAVMTSVVIGNAFYQKKQFYPTVVYITKSKPSMAVMYAQALLFVVMLGKLFRKVFFGQLRAAEFEHLVERSWYAVTETCLAFTVFRDDFSPKFLALFTLLLFLKSFHWLAEERVDYMERSPVITWVFHVRVLSLLSILLLMDVYFVNMAYQSTITKGASVQLVFGFEYAILTTIVLNTVAKYVFHVIDMQNETPWENKAVFVLHTEVIIGLFKVILYILFVVIMVRIFTLPLFALRPTYLALRAFKKALNDVVMSRRAINNMNNLYPDVTTEELANTDNVCIICREEMTGGAKKLPCNHIFHVSCLRSWFQRQQTCPTCRLNVLRVTPTAGVGAGAGGLAGAFAAGLNFNQFQQFRAAPGGVVWGAPAWGQQQQQQAQAQPAAGPAPGPGPEVPGGEGAAAPPPQQPTAQQQQQGQAQQQRGQFPFMFAPGPPPPFMFRGNVPGAGDQTQQQNNTGNPYPFAMPPMPYIPLVPPPPPLLQTTGLTEEELRRMEGTARENVEARLRCLRNVQILLDSAVVQMQQYSAVVANFTPDPSVSTPTSSTAPVAGGSGTASSSGNQSTTSAPTHNSSTTSTSNIGTGSIPPPPTTEAAKGVVEGVDLNSGTLGANASLNTSTPEEDATSSSTTIKASSDNQDELRKRRLQRFTTNQQGGPE